MQGSGRLFRKLVIALCGGMLISMVMPIGYLRLTGHPPPPPDALPTFGGIPIVFLAFSALAILITGLALAWYLSRPLQHLSWALRRVAEGRFDTRVLPLMGGRQDEIIDLAQEFDRMAEQLQRLTSSRELLLHDISHELRSPVTRMQAAIGLLRQDAAQTPAMIERIQHECERLDELVEELLTLHRIEARRSCARLGRVDILEILHAIAEDADFEAGATARSVVIDAPGSFVAEVDGELIYRAYENVIRNAVKFTAPHTTVEIRTQVNPDNALLVTQVRDHGPGVPPEMLEAIFDPFTRVEGSESVRGTGLGLAIARRTIELHGGSITAALPEGGGLAIRLALPAGGAGSDQSGSR